MNPANFPPFEVLAAAVNAPVASAAAVVEATIVEDNAAPAANPTVLKCEQGCPTKDRPLSANDGRLSVWHADQMT